MMLVNLGAKSVIEAGDGLAALEAIRNSDPDVMLLDWDMPVLNGIEVLRIVRSPGVFPRPNLPTIMLTTRAQRAQVAEAMRAGVHEFLDQADLAQGVARPARRDHGQSAADGEDRQVLCAAAAAYQGGGAGRRLGGLRQARFQARRGEIEKRSHLQRQQPLTGIDEAHRPRLGLELLQRQNERAGRNRLRGLVRKNARQSDRR